MYGGTCTFTQELMGQWTTIMHDTNYKLSFSELFMPSLVLASFRASIFTSVEMLVWEN